jgi:hypothetical protein
VRSFSAAQGNIVKSPGGPGLLWPDHINSGTKKQYTHTTISNLLIEKTKWVISAGQLSSSLKSKGGRKPNLAKGYF